MTTASDETTPVKCRWCGLLHGPQCPSVKAIEYHPDGAVKRVEFVTDNDKPSVTLRRALQLLDEFYAAH